MDSLASEAIQALRSWSAGNQLIRFKLTSSTNPSVEILRTDIGFSLAVSEDDGEISLESKPARVVFSLISAEQVLAVRMFDAPDEIEAVVASFPEATLHLARFKASLDTGRLLQ